MDVVWSAVAVVCLVLMLAGPWVLTKWLDYDHDVVEQRIRERHQPDGNTYDMGGVNVVDEPRRGSWRDFLWWYP